MGVAEVNPEQAKQLREAFPPAAVGKLPKPLRKDAEKGTCQTCGGWHGLPAVHLDYVGHAAVTDRLLQVDADWSWEPFALTANGLPALDGDGNLWIRLTVAGTTRPGVGDGANMKERIGDALRNAAMRFGVALDLWAKEDISVTTASEDEKEADRVFNRLRGLNAEQQGALRALAVEREKKLTVNALVDPDWRGEVEMWLGPDPALSEAMADALEGGS